MSQPSTWTWILIGGRHGNVSLSLGFWIKSQPRIIIVHMKRLNFTASKRRSSRSYWTEEEPEGDSRLAAFWFGITSNVKVVVANGPTPERRMLGAAWSWDSRMSVWYWDVQGIGRCCDVVFWQCIYEIYGGTWPCLHWTVEAEKVRAGERILPVKLQSAVTKKGPLWFFPEPPKSQGLQTLLL